MTQFQQMYSKHLHCGCFEQVFEGFSEKFILVLSFSVAELLASVKSSFQEKICITHRNKSDFYHIKEIVAFF